MKKHLKRLNAPKHWMLDKLGGAFVSRSFNVFLPVYNGAFWRLMWFFFSCRPPSLHLDHTSLGSASHSFSSCETGWSMPWHTVKSLLFWCSDMSLLITRSGLTRLTQLVSWVSILHIIIQNNCTLHEFICQVSRL